MATNYGKPFERKFKEDFLKTVPNSTIDRLYDSVSGYKCISNISDFIGYSYPSIFYLECKSIHGNTFPLTNLSQYDKLVKKVGIKGVRTGVIIWFVDHSKIYYVPISTIKKMKEDNKKSVNIKDLDEGIYRIIDIPSEKRRIFMDSNYSCLLELSEGE